MKKQLQHSGRNRRISMLLSLCLNLIVFFSQSYAQTFSVRGKITASRYAVQNAAVTFIDNADTTRKFSAFTDASGVYQIDVTTSAGFNTNNLPGKFELAQNYPNPFSALTTITYHLKERSEAQITIFNILGREVRKFVVGMQTAGSHNIIWDGRDSFGNRVVNGIYFYQLQTANESQVRRMILNSGGTSSKSLLRAAPAQISKVLSSFQGGNYSVWIDNTGETFPFIVAKHIENVSIKNDTTIDITVTSITTTTVNFGITHQYIRGFGASNIVLWRPDMTDSEIKTAFGTGEGQLGFTILRLMVEPNKNRWSLNVPTAKKAHNMGATIIAAPWHAPTEMVEKVNGITRVRYDMYDKYATHLDSFNTYMSKSGVPIYGLSVQNEPDITDQWTSWTAEEIFRFMKENAQAITGTNVMAPESFQFRRSMSDPILNDPIACANINIICGHIYGGGLASYPLAQNKGKEVWMTEHLSGEKDTENVLTWDWSMTVAKEINDVMEAGMSAYVWWYIVRYYGPISDGTNNSGRKGQVTKKGYVMSQYSRFIRPDFHRIECKNLPWSQTLNVTAYKDSLSSRAVIVAVNSSSAPLDLAIRIQNGSMNLLTPYTTTEFKNCVQGDDINIVDNRFTFRLEASSITTFVSK